MAKVKKGAIDEIAGTNVFSNVDTFKSLASQYKSSRTFITLKPERINRIKINEAEKQLPTCYIYRLTATEILQSQQRTRPLF